ncbi:hypothetical protein HK104_006104 [Borealophlyctis nickersoniae]|nr:hypothetical protein HK104_006104 [Borealophlyctis nickersoniae]
MSLELSPIVKRQPITYHAKRPKESEKIRARFRKRLLRDLGRAGTRVGAVAAGWDFDEEEENGEEEGPSGEETEDEEVIKRQTVAKGSKKSGGTETNKEGRPDRKAMRERKGGAVRAFDTEDGLDSSARKAVKASEEGEKSRTKRQVAPVGKAKGTSLRVKSKAAGKPRDDTADDVSALEERRTKKARRVKVDEGASDGAPVSLEESATGTYRTPTRQRRSKAKSSSAEGVGDAADPFDFPQSEADHHLRSEIPGHTSVFDFLTTTFATPPQTPRRRKNPKDKSGEGKSASAKKRKTGSGDDDDWYTPTRKPKRLRFRRASPDAVTEPNAKMEVETPTSKPQRRRHSQKRTATTMRPEVQETCNVLSEGSSVELDAGSITPCPVAREPRLRVKLEEDTLLRPTRPHSMQQSAASVKDGEDKQERAPSLDPRGETEMVGGNAGMEHTAQTPARPRRALIADTSHPVPLSFVGNCDRGASRSISASASDLSSQSSLSRPVRTIRQTRETGKSVVRNNEAQQTTCVPSTPKRSILHDPISATTPVSLKKAVNFTGSTILRTLEQDGCGNEEKFKPYGLGEPRARRMMGKVPTEKAKGGAVKASPIRKQSAETSSRQPPDQVQDIESVDGASNIPKKRRTAMKEVNLGSRSAAAAPLSSAESALSKREDATRGKAELPTQSVRGNNFQSLDRDIMPSAVSQKVKEDVDAGVAADIVPPQPAPISRLSSPVVQKQSVRTERSVPFTDESEKKSLSHTVHDAKQGPEDERRLMLKPSQLGSPNGEVHTAGRPATSTKKDAKILVLDTPPDCVPSQPLLDSPGLLSDQDVPICNQDVPISGTASPSTNASNSPTGSAEWDSTSGDQPCESPELTSAAAISETSSMSNQSSGSQVSVELRADSSDSSSIDAQASCPAPSVAGQPVRLSIRAQKSTGPPEASTTAPAPLSRGLGSGYPRAPRSLLELVHINKNSWDRAIAGGRQKRTLVVTGGSEAKKHQPPPGSSGSRPDRLGESLQQERAHPPLANVAGGAVQRESAVASPPAPLKIETEPNVGVTPMAQMKTMGFECDGTKHRTLRTVNGSGKSEGGMNYLSDLFGSGVL